MKNILVLSSSLRKGSNSEILAQEFAKGAADAGNKVELLPLRKLLERTRIFFIV